MSTQNLWGDFPDGEDIRTPSSILKEQISYLEQGTKGLLTGTVSRQSEGDVTVLKFIIIAPALNNYMFEVTTIKHSMALYPLRTFDPNNNTWFRCEDEATFNSCLGEILKSKYIKDILSGLLAQIKAEIP